MVGKIQAVVPAGWYRPIEPSKKKSRLVGTGEPEAQRVYREALGKAEDPAQRTRIEEKLRGIDRAATPGGRSL